MQGRHRRQGSQGWILRNRKQRWQHQLACLPKIYSGSPAYKYSQFMEHLVLLTLDDDISLVLLLRLKKESAAAAMVATTAAKVGIEPPMLI